MSFHLLARLESYGFVDIGYQVGEVNRSYDFCIFAGQVLVGDPTGPCSATSDMDRRAIGYGDRHYVFQRTKTNGSDRVRNTFFH